MDVIDFPPPKSILQLLKEALGEQPNSFAVAAQLAAAALQAGQDSSMSAWWLMLARQLGRDQAGLQPTILGTDGLQLLQQGAIVTGISAHAEQQSGLQLLCDPAIAH